MAPIPTQTKKKLQQTVQQNVSASDVAHKQGSGREKRHQSSARLAV